MLTWEEYRDDLGCAAYLCGVPVGRIAKPYPATHLNWYGPNKRKGMCDSLEDGKRAVHIAVMEWFVKVGETFDDWSNDPSPKK